MADESGEQKDIEGFDPDTSQQEKKRSLQPFGIPKDVQEHFEEVMRNDRPIHKGIDEETSIHPENLLLISKYGDRYSRAYYHKQGDQFRIASGFTYNPTIEHPNANIFISHAGEGQSLITGHEMDFDISHADASESLSFNNIVTIGAPNATVDMDIGLVDLNNPTETDLSLRYFLMSGRRRIALEFLDGNDKISFRPGDENSPASFSVSDKDTQDKLKDGRLEVVIENEKALIKIRNEMGLVTDDVTIPLNIDIASTFASFVPKDVIDQPFTAPAEADRKWKQPIARTLGIKWNKLEKERQGREKLKDMLDSQKNLPDDSLPT